MAQTTIAVRVDEEDKKAFELFCNSTGMNISVAINVFLKNVIQRQALPFIVEADPFYAKENISELERRVNDLKKGKTKLKEHDLIEVD